MRTVKKFGREVLGVVAAFIALDASAKDSTLQVSNVMSSIHDKLASMPIQQSPDSFGASDMLLAVIAGVVLVILQLRRHQKIHSETRIVNLNHLQSLNTRLINRVAESNLSQAGKPGLIAHAEQG